MIDSSYLKTTISTLTGPADRNFLQGGQQHQQQQKQLVYSISQNVQHPNLFQTLEPVPPLPQPLFQQHSPEHSSQHEYSISASNYHIYDQILNDQLHDRAKKLEQEQRNKVVGFSLAMFLLVSSLVLITVELADWRQQAQTSFTTPNKLTQMAARIELDGQNSLQSSYETLHSNQPKPSSSVSSESENENDNELLIGEFVILNQAYSYSEAQRSALAERVVKLMDQVFLSSDMRLFYSRMRITEMIPHKPMGVLVKCNIILGEPVLYAAQQFGIALYDSLTRSNEKLANQSSFIIDRSSIRFRTERQPTMEELAPEKQPVPIGGDQDQAQNQNAVVWSEWSNWSSCVDKNGICDSGRLHSRLRKCVSQLTGERVDGLECRKRFSMQDLELEVTNCEATCSNSGVQSDAPEIVSPSSEPSLYVPYQERLERVSDDWFSQQPVKSSIGSLLFGASNNHHHQKQQQQQQQQQQKQQQQLSSSSQPATTNSLSLSLGYLNGAEGSQQQMSCSNCTSSEICLLTINQKVPFCAKIKDRLDESGCGGWCKGHDQVCQPAGQNAFKCAHNSECLPSEWRCNDSQCIPASKRCDGHENCFDSSDEAFCP